MSKVGYCMLVWYVSIFERAGDKINKQNFINVYVNICIH